jgi:hypothetical protein
MGICNREEYYFCRELMACKEKSTLTAQNKLRRAMLVLFMEQVQIGGLREERVDMSNLLST